MESKFKELLLTSIEEAKTVDELKPILNRLVTYGIREIATNKLTEK